MTPTHPDGPQSKATISTSRRNFIKGAQLVLGAGAALSLSSMIGSNAHAQGKHGRHRDGGGQGNGHGGNGNGRPENPGGGYQCFLAGTLIETASGAVAVEELRIGDAVLTASGEAKPVKWIGKQTTSQPPVKVAAFAIDGNAPTRDLYITPWHSIYIDGFLVPAISLVNGVSIIANAKSQPSPFTYYHIEFEAHEVIRAEGLAVESFCFENAVVFDNADEYVELYGPRTQSMAPVAPMLCYAGRKGELASRVRSTLACVHDIRTPLDKIRDRIADQAEWARAA